MADQKEREIPVFSVWKNNAILKNVFLVNAPPSLDDIPSQTGKIGENGKTHEEFEETLVIGRHPDCDIRLEHPSISRFHLRIHSKPSSLHLSLTDLSSVHGTWVSGTRIEPNVRTMMKEGDTLRMGGSSRVYKLHWIPLSQAYDMEHPFVPPLDYPEPQEDDEEEIFKDENSPGLKNVDVNVVDSVSKCLDSSVMCDGNELIVEERDVLAENEDTKSVDSDFDGLESLSRDANNDAFVQKCISPAPSVQNQNSDVLENEDDLEFDSILEGLVPLFLGENWEWVGQEENHLECPQVDNSPLPFKHEDEGFVASVLEGSDTFLDENSELLAHKIIPSAPPLLENMTFDLALKLNHSIADGEGGSEPLGEINQRNGKQNPLPEDVQESKWNFWDGSLVKNYHLDRDNQYTEHEMEPIVLSHRKSSTKEHEAGTLWSFWSGKMGIESMCSSLSHIDVFSESENESLRNDYQSPQTLSSVKKQLGSSLMTSEQGSAHSIWSRRGKQERAPHVLTSRTEGKKIKTAQKNVKHDPISRALFHGVDDQEEVEIFTPDKENLTPNTHRSMRKLAVLSEVKCLNSGKSSLLHGVDDDQEEEEIFIADKENLTPNTHRSMRKLAVLSEVTHSNSRKSSHFKMPCSSDIYYEDCMSPASSNDNSLKAQTVRPRQRKAERLPFQTLLADLPQKSMPETCFLDAAMISGNSVSCAKAKSKTHLQDKCFDGRIQSWKMVVDTTTLLNKESRKALQLLEGLKGTQLIIPRIVIRELDCLKRQVSFFRRNSEVSSALEWIQDCMMKTQWWIHVQSSIEEGRPVAPTPPASPHSQFSCGTVTSVPFLVGSRTELLSPTTEDHVLDYAISFRKTINDGQLVLLSNDVTLKIKSMAEGLTCEEAEEFRESLVNPFSERFLWADSSPRGQTWSCSDDFVLQEKFYPSSLKMTPKSMENVKGLKLILLHNSQYFERMTAIR